MPNTEDSMDTIARPIPASAIAALERGDKVEAIRITRKTTGMGLKESREAVEALMHNDRRIDEAYRSNRARGGKLANLGWLLLVVGLIGWLLSKAL